MIKNVNFVGGYERQYLTQDLVEKLAVELEERREMETTCPDKYCWGLQV